MYHKNQGGNTIYNLIANDMKYHFSNIIRRGLWKTRIADSEELRIANSPE